MSTDTETDKPMRHADFKIGADFMCGGARWRCTDVGTRTIVAIRFDADASWMAGPPYAVEEVAFAETDFGGCTSVQP